jgi:hypothetical protein
MDALITIVEEGDAIREIGITCDNDIALINSTVDEYPMDENDTVSPKDAAIAAAVCKKERAIEEILRKDEPALANPKPVKRAKSV